MLKKRLIPILLLKDGRMVKTVNFGNFRDVGSPITTAKIYDAQTVDEIIFLDIMASSNGRKFLLNVIDEVTRECFMPFTAGGGVKNLDDISQLLKVGADKVAINTAAVKCPDFIKEAAARFGSANIIVAVDYRKITGQNKVFINSGQEETIYDLETWIGIAKEKGAGEILLNCIDRDGTMAGYDIETVKRTVESVNIPVIACGGAGKLFDFIEVFEKGQAAAAAAGSIFHFTDQSPIKAKAYLKEAGINIRVEIL